ncbi:MAG: amino acid ABC transporter permease [Nocardioidaceae bacterium]
MDTLIDNWPDIWDGFETTLWLSLFAGIAAGLLGTLMGSMRVSPVTVLRAVGTTYVNIFRNTPLVVVLILVVAGLPELGFNNWDIDLGFREFNTFFVFGTLGLSLYTGAFVCEAVRSGINSVDPGQTEASRSIGMNFTQTLQQVVLPQAFRSVVPPLASVYIAMAKNTSVLAIFGVTEATYQMKRLGNNFSSDLYWIFGGISLGYVVIVLTISGVAAVLERKLAVAR